MGYAVESDKEHGEGRPDILIRDKGSRRAMIIEVKLSSSEKTLKTDCAAAVHQIAMQKYARDCLEEGYKTIICYGAAFYKKQCQLQRAETTA